MLFQKSKLWDFRLVSTSDFWWVFWLLQSLLLRRCRPVRKWSDRFHTSVQRGLKGTTTHSKDRKREARTYMAKNVFRKFQGAVEECAKKNGWGMFKKRLRNVPETELQQYHRCVQMFVCSRNDHMFKRFQQLFKTCSRCMQGVTRAKIAVLEGAFSHTPGGGHHTARAEKGMSCSMKRDLSYSFLTQLWLDV